MRRRLDVKFLALLLLAMTLGGGGVHVVHGFQEGRTARSLLRRGEQAERRGDLAEAETWTARYLALRPGDVEALADFGVLLDRRASTPRDRLRAMQVLERALARSPGRSDLRRRVVDLAMTDELRRYRDARDHLRVLLEDSPEDGALEGKLARCHEAFALGEDTDARQARDAKAASAEAAAWYASSITHAPGRIESYVRLAALLRGPLKDEARADSIMDAREVRDGLIAANPDSAAAFLARARYRRDHRIPGGDQDSARALALAPDDADALLAAADSAREAGEPDEARRHLARGVERHPDDARFYQGQADLEVRAGRPAEAIAALRRGLGNIPGQKNLLWNLADLLIQVGREGEAESGPIARLRTLDDFHPAALNYLEARLLVVRKKWAEAVRRLEQARAFSANKPDSGGLTKQIDLLLAQGYHGLGNPDRQLAACRRVLAVDPGSVAARSGLGAALVALGRPDEALEEYRKVAEHDPSARLPVAQLLIGRTLRLPAGRRDWSEVDRALDEAERANPGAPDVALLRADTLAARGEVDRAGDLLRQARRRHPDRTEPWVALADLAARGPKPEAALVVLEEARQALGDRAEWTLARARYWARRGGDEAARDLGRLAEQVDRAEGDDRARLAEGLADAFARIGDTRRAGALLARVAEARPDDLKVAAELFDLALGDYQADGPEVRQALRRLRAIEGEDGALWRHAEAARLVVLARAGDRDRLDEARRLLAEVAGRRPEWSRVARMEAEIAEMEERPEKAAEAYLRAIGRGDRHPQFIRRAVQLLNGLGRHADADRVIQQLVERSAPVGLLGQLAAESSLRQGDFEQALEFARGAVPASSTDHRDHLWLGRIYWATEHRPEAGVEIRRALDLAGTSPEAWVAWVEFLSRTDRKDEAEAATREAALKIPADRAPMALAQCDELIGRPERAESQYQAALAAQPENALLLQVLASFYLRYGQDVKAEPLLRKILDERTRAPASLVSWARRKSTLGVALRGDYQQVKAGLAELERGMRGSGGADAAANQRVKALLLARLPAAEGRRDAIRAFEDLARIRPLTPDEKYLLAQLHLDDHNWPRARDLLLGALAADGENPLYLAGLARGLLARGHADEAEPYLAKLERLRPENGQTVELRARALSAVGQGARAADSLRAYARSKPIHLGLIAALLEELGQIPPAEETYRLYASRGKRPEAVLPLAQFLARQGRFGEALDLCDQAWATCPPEAVGRASLVIAFGNAGDDAIYRRVGDGLERAARDHPESINLLFDLANLRSRQGRYPDAEALYRQVVQRDLRNENPLNNLAWLLAVAGGKGDEALSLIGRAIELAGPRPDLLDTRAVVYLSQGRHAEAIRDLDSAIAAGPSADMYLHLAQAYHAARDDRAARDSLEKARAQGLKVNTLHPLERKAYDRLVVDLGEG